MSPFDLLGQLRHLNQSSLEFPDRLTNLLHKQEHRTSVASLQGDDLAWLVEYLDNVRLRITRTDSPLKLG